MKSRTSRTSNQRSRTPLSALIDLFAMRLDLRPSARIEARRAVGADAGLALIRTIVGAAVVSVILGGLAIFYVNSSKSGRTTSELSVSQSTGVQVLNRIGKDVQETTRLLKATGSELVVESSVGSTQAKDVKRTYYKLSGSGGSFDLVQRTERVPSSTPYDPTASWASTKTLARNLTGASKFEYFTRTGASTTTLAQVARVDTTYVAKISRNGLVSLKSSAAIKGVTGNGGGAAGAPAPVPVNDTVTIAAGAVSTSVNVIDGSASGTNGADSCNATTPCSGTFTTTLTTAGAPSGLTITKISESVYGVQVAAGVPAGTYSFGYTLTDASGQSGVATLSVVVTGGSSALAPTARADSISITPGVSVSVNVIDGSAGGADSCNNSATTCTGSFTTSINTSGAPAGLSVTKTNESVYAVTTTASLAPGTYNLPYTLTDANGSSTANLTISVTSGGATVQPNAVSDSVTLTQGASATVNVIDGSASGGNPDKCNASTTNCTGSYTTSVNSTGGPAGLSVTKSSESTYTVTTTAGTPAGTYNFSYTLTDANGSSTATFQVVVNAAGCTTAAPSAVADSVALVRGGTAVTIDVYTNDSIPAGSTKTLSALPGGVTATNTASNGSVTVSVGSGYTGGNFSYTVTNTCGVTSTATVTLLVIGAVNDTFAIVKNSGASGSTSGNIQNNDFKTASPTTAQNGATPNGFTVSIGSNGATTITAGSSVAGGTYTIGYTLTQSAGSLGGSVSDNGTITVNVTANAAPNPAPVAKAFPASTPAQNATTGTNRVTWNDNGFAPYTVQYSTDGGSSFTTLVGGINGTSFDHVGVPLGSNFSYRVIDSQSTPQTGTADNSQQFPPDPVVTTQGSDRNGDLVPDALGNNVVSWTPYASAPAAARYVVNNHNTKQTQGDSNGLVPTPVESSGDLAATSWTDNGEARGSEAIYVVAAYYPCDPDLSSAGISPTRSASPGCGSPSAYFLPTYSAAPKAYQAPTTAPTQITIGSATALSSCNSNSNRTVVNANGADRGNASTDTGNVAAPNLTNPTVDTNQYYDCSDKSATLKFSVKPDEGDPSDPFCSNQNNVNTTNVCWGMRARQDGAVPSQSAIIANATRSGPSAGVNGTSVFASAWGATDQWGLLSCNPGGCSGVASTTAYAFPGKYAINDFSQGDGKRGVYYRLYRQNVCDSPCTNEQQSTIFSWDWNNANGADEYTIRTQRLGGFGNADRDTSETSVGTAQTSGVVPAFDSTGYQVRTRAYIARNAGTLATRYRGVTAGIATSPPTASFIQDSPFCKNNASNNTLNGWKYGVAWRLSPQAPASGINNSNRSSAANFVSGAHGMLWAGTVNLNTSNGDAQVGKKAADYWYAGDSASWPTVPNWDNNTVVYENWDPAADWTTTNKKMLGTIGDDSTRIPWSTSAGNAKVAHVRMELYNTDALARSFVPGTLLDFVGRISGNWQLPDGTTAPAYDTTAKGQNDGSGIRARATDVPDPGRCGSNAGDRFDSGAAWYAMSGYVTRRVDSNLSGSDSNTTTTRFNQVGGYPA